VLLQARQINRKLIKEDAAQRRLFLSTGATPLWFCVQNAIFRVVFCLK
jgi:hypothetical protein